MTNKFTQKLLLWIFIVWISFFWMNVFAASSANKPEQCSSVTNYSANWYSANSSNWNVFQNNSTRYINKNSAIDLGFSLCTAKYCSQWASAVKSYRDKILGLSSYNSHTDVRNLQKKLQDLGCSVSTDCKLWVNTLTQYFNCDICSKNSFTSPDSLNWSDIVCAAWTVPASGWNFKDVCCEKLVPIAPDIIVDWTVCNGTCEYNSTKNTLKVVIDYSKNTSDVIEWSKAVDVSGWWEKSWSITTWAKTLSFDIKPNGWEITIAAAEWAMKLTWNISIPGKTAKLTSTWCGTPTSSTWSCPNGYVAYANCCEQCNSAPTTWGIDDCESIYWSWYSLQWACCSCDPSKIKCPEWEKVAGWDSCKCICDPDVACCGVKLNTVVPFIWDCIEMTTSNDPNSASRTWTVAVNQLNAFPFLMQWLMKILITVILIFSIIVVIVAWLMMTWSVAQESRFSKWKDLLKNVIISLILLWCSWLILKLINPSFFGG